MAKATYMRAYNMILKLKYDMKSYDEFAELPSTPKRSIKIAKMLKGIKKKQVITCNHYLARMETPKFRRISAPQILKLIRLGAKEELERIFSNPEKYMSYACRVYFRL